jgi:hypothetical protein
MRIRGILAPIGVLIGLLVQPTAAQQVETKWRFAGNEVGFTNYQPGPDGKFESMTEIDLAGRIKSNLTGRFTDGVLVEFELVNNVRGDEFRVAARDGKVRITAKGRTRELDFKPPTALFNKYHPIFAATIIKALDPQKEGVQEIEIFALGNAAPLKIQISKKKTLTFEAQGKKQIATVYLLRFASGEEIDLYLDDQLNFAAWDLPSQKTQVTRSGVETLLVDPTTLYPELSQPTMTPQIERGLRIRMRDGVETVADLVRPDAAGKYPTILVRTPYGRELQTQAEGAWWARRGYAYIAQDVRGRNDSGGEWNPFFNERKDGYDTIAWISKQPWSDGKVGMIGGSYLGWVQWAAAAEAHPALKCIVPQVSPPDLFFNFPYDHGVPMLYLGMMWLDFVKDKKTARALMPVVPVDKLKTLPLPRIDDEVLGRNIPYFDRWFEDETYSAFAGAGFMADMKKIKIPILHISGWWDGDGIGTKLNWAAMRALGHKDQWLIYGPWGHRFNASSRMGDVDYGPDAILELDSIYLRWFDQWLKGKPARWEEQPRVRAFVTGANEWRELTDWPDPLSKEMTLYLSSRGPANGKLSAGELSPEHATEQEPDRYTYNPASVQIPKELTELTEIGTGGSTQIRFEAYDEDVLIYKTAPMAASLEIGGPIELDLHFSTSAKDTDFFAYLVDIDEHDIMRLIGKPGKIRAKYLEGWDKPTPLQSGKTYRATIALWDTAHRLEKGHRLGILIQSQMFPAFARNLNTGEPIKTATRMVAAHQTIYHDARRPSALRFRVLPASRQKTGGGKTP